MTVSTYDFENGTDGALLTNALTGGHVYGSNGHFSATGAVHGNLGCVYAFGDLYHRVGWAFTGSTQVAVRTYFKASGVNTSTGPTNVFQICDSADTKMLAMSWSPSGGYFDVTAGGVSVGGTHVAADPTTGPLRLEMVADQTAGSASYSIYSGDSETALGTLSTSSGLDFGTGPFAQVDIGVVSSSGLTSGNFYFDDIAWSPGATSEIGPYVAPPSGPTPGAYVWTGTAWQRGTFQVYDGSTWQTADVTTT